MALLLKKLYNGYFWLFTELADPRPTDLGFFFMSSPIQPMILIGAYLYFCISLGPKLMKNRKPFDLKGVIIVYNILQILLNAKIFYESVIEVSFFGNWRCYPIDYGTSERTLHVLRMYHLFFMIKCLDLVDTVFFVLRKKNNQLSFLHIYHHFGMYMMLWLVLKFLAGGHGVYVGLINSFVHIIMFFYYTLAALEHPWALNMALKKFITQAQLIQFGAYVLIYGRLLFIDCAYPKLPCYLFVSQNVFMFYMFGDFYIKTYLKKRK